MDCSKITQNLVAASCANAEIPGIASRVILLNYSDIDQIGIVEVNNVVSELPLIEGAVGFKFESLDGATLGSSVLVTGVHYNEFEHSVDLRIFVKTEAAKAFMNTVKNAHLVAILENSSYNVDENPIVKYEIYGLYAGLTVGEAVHTTELTDGIVYSLKLKSPNSNKETTKPKTFFNTDLTTTDTIIELINSVKYSVKFIDYDTTTLKTQLVIEGTNATPPVAAQTDLTFLHWLGSYTNVTHKKVVLAEYKTDTVGSTRYQIYITLDAVTGLTPTLKMWISASSAGSLINWGDGVTTYFTADEYSWQSKSHTYAVAGSYRILVAFEHQVKFGADDDGTNQHYPLFVGNYLQAITKYYDSSIPVYSVQTAIGGHCFENCVNLQKAIITSVATELNRFAFHNCSSLANLIVPTGVVSIGESCFSGCTGLQKLIFLSTTPASLYFDSVFTGVPASTKIFVPDANVATYKAAAYWSNRANQIFPMSSL